jgi:hypothetical protein
LDDETRIGQWNIHGKRSSDKSCGRCGTDGSADEERRLGQQAAKFSDQEVNGF